MVEFVGKGTRLIENDFIEFGQRMGVEPEVVHAVCEVESAGGGFLPDKRPKILFEAHVFHRQTRGLYGNNNISAKRWDRSLYGASGGHQYERLNEAIHLDREAGLKSASWGLFQIMGFNHKSVGYDRVEEFVLANMEGERQQLEMFGEFCKVNDLIPYLRNKEWSKFVHRYNGPGQVTHYVGKLTTAYEKWKGKNLDNEITERVLRFGSKGRDVEELQGKLDVEADGVFGAETLKRVKEFQSANALAPDGVVGNLTRNRLDAMEDDKEEDKISTSEPAAEAREEESVQ